MREEFKKILIVRTDRIGDVVLTTPVIKALRNAYPDSKIDFLLAPLTKSLIEGNPDINEVIVDDREGEYKGAGIFKLVNRLRKEKFDLAIIYHTKKRTNSLCFMAGIPRRVGYKNNKFGFLLTDRIEDQRHFGKKHEAEYCMDVLASIQIPAGPLVTKVSISDESERWVEATLKKHNISEADKLVAIHPGASDSTKCWPAKRFAELIDQMSKNFEYKFIIVGAQNIVKVAQDIKKSCQSPVVDFCTQTTVSQMVSLLKRCAMFISNDSGPVHIADALGIPVISIFTRNQPGINPERWRPLGKRSRVVCTKFNGDISLEKGKIPDPAYLDSIQVSDVIEAVDSLFKLC